MEKNLIEGDVLQRGKRYRLESHPWNFSYLEAIKDDNGAWIYSPIGPEKERGVQAGRATECGYYTEIYCLLRLEKCGKGCERYTPAP